MFKWLEKLKWSMSEEASRERRHAHKMILLSSCGGARIAGKDGKMQIEHEKVSDDE